MNGDKYTLPPVFGTTELERSLLDPQIWTRFGSLDQSGKICAEYVWIGGTGASVIVSYIHHACCRSLAGHGGALVVRGLSCPNPRLIYLRRPCRCRSQEQDQVLTKLVFRIHLRFLNYGLCGFLLRSGRNRELTFPMLHLVASRVINKAVKSAAELPVWNYDGSSTGQVRDLWTKQL